MAKMIMEEIWTSRDGFIPNGSSCGRANTVSIRRDDSSIGLRAEEIAIPSMKPRRMVLIPVISRKEALDLVSAVASCNSKDFFSGFRLEPELESAGITEEGAYIRFSSGPGSWLDEPKHVRGVNQVELLREAIVIAAEGDQALIPDRLLAHSEKIRTPKLKAMIIHSAALARTMLPETTSQEIIEIMLQAWRASKWNSRYLDDAAKVAADLGIPFSEDDWEQFEDEAERERLDAEMGHLTPELRDYFADGMK